MIEITSINRSEALRYMGYNKNTNTNISNIIPLLDECEKRLLSVIKPRFIYKAVDIECSDFVKIKNSSVIFKGNDITAHLKGCDKAIMLAATLSNAADKLIAEYQVNDMSSAIICDCMSNAAIEQVCDYAEQEIKKNISDYYMTWRFSPGYGDFSIEYQKDFIYITDAARKIGLTLNDSNILLPRKSVTAIIGLSKNEIPPKRRGCAICNMNKTCQLRKRGEHCGF